MMNTSLRQTGRTTRMLLDACRAVVEGKTVFVFMSSYSYIKEAKSLLRKIGVSYNVISAIKFSSADSVESILCSWIFSENVRIFADHTVYESYDSNCREVLKAILKHNSFLNNMKKRSEFTKELTHLLNRFGKDSEVGVADYILAKYLEQCIDSSRNLLIEKLKHES